MCCWLLFNLYHGTTRWSAPVRNVSAHEPQRVPLQSLTSSNANQNTTTVKHHDCHHAGFAPLGRPVFGQSCGTVSAKKSLLVCAFVAKFRLFFPGKRSTTVLVSCKVKLCFFGTTLSLPTVAEPNLETKLDSSRSTFAREENLTVSHRLQFFFVERGTKKLVFERFRWVQEPQQAVETKLPQRNSNLDFWWIFENIWAGSSRWIVGFGDEIRYPPDQKGVLHLRYFRAHLSDHFTFWF